MFTKTNLTTSLLSLALTFSAVAPAVAAPKETPKAEQKAKSKKDVGTMIDIFKGQTKKATDEDIAKALTTLATAADKKVVRYLAKYVLHKSDEVADAALNGLGTLSTDLDPRGKRMCMQAVMPALRLTKKNPYRVGVACKSLETIGDIAAVQPLLKLVEHDNVKIAKAAATVLKTVKHRSAIEPLISELTKLEWSPRGRNAGQAAGSTPAGWGRGNLACST
ncbi:MAG: HEAT repeat domain-containing protein [Planctomycetota bacterium]|jgi:HEAT repeat protein